MSGPVSGIRVVDFSRVLAGPLCARTLVDLGAEVIKIEPPRPDVSRFAFPSTPGMSGYYAQQNAGKRNVSIDLNVPGARALALRLCDTADVVVENFRAGTLGFFGLDYQTLAARNPRLIYASITGYGQGGPWQGRMAYAPTVQAEAGFTANSMRHYGEILGEPRTDSLSVLHGTGRRAFHRRDEPRRFPHLPIISAGNATRRPCRRPALRHRSGAQGGAFRRAASHRAGLDPDVSRHRCPRRAIGRGQDSTRRGALPEEALRDGVGGILGCGPGSSGSQWRD